MSNMPQDNVWDSTLALMFDGYRFPKGTRLLPDLYGTNFDTRIWQQPERFRRRDESPFNFIPQGGGGHRCADEWITRKLMKIALRVLTEPMIYIVPEQDLSLSQMPPLPKSRFVIGGIKLQLE
ncbi:MAG: cytochrome P450 [Methylobacter sp.]